MSATIITLHDPAGINKQEVEGVSHGTLLMDFLIQKYGVDGFAVPTKIYSGTVDDDHEIDLHMHSEDGYEIQKDL